MAAKIVQQITVIIINYPTQPSNIPSDQSIWFFLYYVPNSILSNRFNMSMPLRRKIFLFKETVLLYSAPFQVILDT